MNRLTVAVLRGGPSREYDVSLKSGAAILRALTDHGSYTPRDIFIDRAGQWHRSGAPTTPAQALSQADVVFNALHGEYGEDGSVQHTLDTLGVPYTGSGTFASSIAFNKDSAKQALKKLDIRMPRGIVVRRADVEDGVEDYALDLFRSFHMPVIIKPLVGGSSIGVMLVTHFDALVEGLRSSLQSSSAVLVEEYIRGREATVGVIDGFRGERRYALPPVEIIPPEGSVFFDHHAKYSGESIEQCPGKFGGQDKYELMDLARRVHEGLDLSHYSRSDFIVTKRGIYFIEANTLPGLTEESLLPKALAAVGSSLPEFLEHVITLAQK